MFVRLCQGTISRKCSNGNVLIANKYNGASVLCSSDTWNYISPLTLKPIKITHIVEGILTKYDVSREEIFNDCIQLYQTLQDERLLKIGDTIASIDDYTLKSLHVEITFACNERCVHCYIPSDTKRNCCSISLNSFIKLVDEFCELGGENISISGGEPLLHPNFREMVGYCSEKNLTINILSNLTLFSDELISFLKKQNIGTIQTSIYSMDSKVHDRITQIPNSLNRTLDKLKRLKKAKLDLSISCPIMNENQESAEDIITFAKHENIPLRLNNELIAQSNRDDSFISTGRLSCNSLSCFLDRIMKFDGEYVKNNLLDINMDQEEIMINNTSEYFNQSICSAGIDHICVSPNGDYYTCPGWNDFTLANIADTSLCDLWFTNVKLRKLRQINRNANYTKCLQCEDLIFCKRCLMQNALEGKLGVFNHRCCQEAQVRRQILKDYNL